MTTPILSILALTSNAHNHGAALQGLDRAIHLALHGRASGLSETVDALTVKGKPSGEHLRLALLASVKRIASRCLDASKVPHASRGEGWQDGVTLPLLHGFTLAYEKAVSEVAALRAERLAEGKAKREAAKLTAATAPAPTPAPTSAPTPAPAPAFDLSDAMQIIEARALMGDVDTLNTLQSLITHLETAGILEVTA